MAIQYSCQENPHWQRGLVDPGGPWGCKESDTTKHAYTHKDVTAYACMLSRFWLYVTPWTVAHQSPPSIGFSRQEYWSGLPFPSQVIFPTQGLNSSFLAFPALADGLFTTGATWEAQFGAINNIRMGERTSLYNITTSCLRSPEAPPSTGRKFICVICYWSWHSPCRVVQDGLCQVCGQRWAVRTGAGLRRLHILSRQLGTEFECRHCVDP